MSSYYVTKYAATKGILEYDPMTLVHTVGPDGRVDVVTIEGKNLKMGTGLFASFNEARLDAIKRTRRKVTALFKKEQKLEAQIAGWEAELSL